MRNILTKSVAWFLRLAGSSGMLGPLNSDYMMIGLPGRYRPP